MSIENSFITTLLFDLDGTLVDSAPAQIPLRGAVFYKGH